MKKLPLFLVAIAAVGCAASPTPAKVDDRAPLKVIDTAGKTLDLDAALGAGRNVALVFWQTWCKPCEREAPALAAAARAHGDAILFVGVVPGKSSPEEVATVVERHHLPYVQVRDEDLALTSRFKVEGTPTIVVLGPGRAVRYTGHRAPDDWKTLRGAAKAGTPGADVCLPDGTCPLPRCPDDEPAAKPAPLVTRTRELGVMGTDLKLELLGTDAAVLDRAIDDAIAELRRIEDLMTDWRPSELTRLNDAAGKGPMKVHPDLAHVIARGIEVGQVTSGAFDITFAGVGRLWDFKKRPPVVPDAESIKAALVVVDYRRVKVDLAASTVEMPAGTRIGLGGIAKGWAIGRAVAVLKAQGVKHAFVKAGGDLMAVGRKDGRLWQIAIKHPREKDRVLGVLPVANTFVGTAGDYERFFEKDGKRYHHILDPTTGYPATGCMTATLLGQDPALVDGLDTAMCVLGPEKGLAVLEKLPGIEGILVGMDGSVHVTKGLRGGAKKP